MRRPNSCWGGWGSFWDVATPSGPCITTSPVSRKIKVVLIGHSPTSKGSRGPHEQAWPNSGQLCCLPGAQGRDIMGKFHSGKTLWLPSAIGVQIGSNKTTKRSSRQIKRHFRALGQLVEGSGAQGAICLILPVARNNIDRNRQLH